MQKDHATKLKRRWRRKTLAEYWGVSERTVDRLHKAGTLADPLYIGRMPTWSDEDREAVERSGAAHSMK